MKCTIASGAQTYCQGSLSFQAPLLQFPFTQIATQVLAKYCIQNTDLQLGKLSTQYKLKIKTYNKTRTKYTVHIEIKTQNKLYLVHSTHSEYKPTIRYTKYTVHIEDKDIKEETKYTVHIEDTYLQ